MPSVRDKRADQKDGIVGSADIDTGILHGIRQLPLNLPDLGLHVILRGNRINRAVKDQLQGCPPCAGNCNGVEYAVYIVRLSSMTLVTEFSPPRQSPPYSQTDTRMVVGQCRDIAPLAGG